MDKINDILSKIKIPVASHGKSLHRFSFPILETADWMTPQPIYTRELRQNDKIDFKASLFGRTDALLNPAFVTGSYHYRFIFVPYRLVQRSYQNMIERTRYTAGNGETFLPETKRYISWGRFQLSLLSDSTLVERVSGSDVYDFLVTSVGSTTTPYRWTTEGRRFFQLMRGLGYAFNWNTQDGHMKDALPLLAWLRAYLDWFFPDQYAENTELYLATDRVLKNDTNDLHVNESNLINLLKRSLTLFYLDDTLSSVWDSPSVGGVTDSANDFSFTDPTYEGNGNNTVANGNGEQTPVIESNSDTPPNPISQWCIDALQAVNNWMIRRKLAGSRLIQRYLASHGVAISNPESYTSYHLNHKVIPIQIGDVENNSSDNTGELAGKGIVRTGGDDFITCDYTAKETGLFMLVRYVLPDARIPMCELPSISKVSCFDNFHNEFQKLGVDAVPANNVFVSNIDTVNAEYIDDATFGFAPRYWFEAAEFPRLLGDFELPSKGAEQLAQLHTFRILNNSDLNALGSLHHSIAFVETYDRERFNRIFYNGEGSNFRNFMFCSVKLLNDKLPNGDSFDWDDDELNKRVELISKSNV